MAAKLHPSLQYREFWYPDALIKPMELPGGFERDDIDLSTQFTKGIRIESPISSAAMDTVTDSKTAIMTALNGGIGVIHYNYRTTEEQMVEVERVKSYQAAFVKRPVVLGPQATVGDVYRVAEERGFYSVPITEDGTLNSKLVGMVTHRDVRYMEDMTKPLGQIMTLRDDLEFANRKETMDKNDIKAANKIIREENLDTLPIVDDDYKLVAMVTDSDLRKDAQYPLATKDDNKQLRVMIAIEGRMKDAEERIYKGHEAGADGYVIDQGIIFEDQLEIAKFIKAKYPKSQVVVGNVASAEQVREIMKEASEYVDAIKAGVGPGEACITHELGVGRPPGSTTYDCAQEIQRLRNKYDDMPLIADGGIKSSGDVVMALALGAASAMIGYLFAGLEESPALERYNEERKRLEKQYRGMGSPEAMRIRGASRYAIEKAAIKVPEGESKWVAYRGSGYKFIPEFLASIRQGMHKLGYRNIEELQEKAHVIPRKF